MKTRKKLIDNVRQIIVAIGFTILLIAFFWAGYFVAWNFLCKPLNDAQFEFCEQVARDVYAQKDQVIVEAPEEVKVYLTTTTIEVKLADDFYRGKVVAKLQNGELVILRDFEKNRISEQSVSLGTLFVIVFIIFVMIGNTIYEKVKKKRSQE